MAIETGIDLSFCVPGQKVKLRDGSIGRYNGLIDENTLYVHAVDGYSYINNGKFWVEDDRISTKDVVEILPLAKPKQPKPDAHPSVAWWESCPWITDRKPTKEDSDHLGQVIQQVSSKFDAGTTLDICFASWEYVKEGKAWIHSLNWKPLKQTPREKALALITKHKDSSTVGVWVPTPDEWDIIREGLVE